MALPKQHALAGDHMYVILLIIAAIDEHIQRLADHAILNRTSLKHSLVIQCVDKDMI